MQSLTSKAPADLQVEGWLSGPMKKHEEFQNNNVHPNAFAFGLSSCFVLTPIGQQWTNQSTTLRMTHPLTNQSITNLLTVLDGQVLEELRFQGLAPLLCRTAEIPGLLCQLQALGSLASIYFPSVIINRNILLIDNYVPISKLP